MVTNYWQPPSCIQATVCHKTVVVGEFLVATQSREHDIIKFSSCCLTNYILNTFVYDGQPPLYMYGTLPAVDIFAFYGVLVQYPRLSLFYYFELCI